MTLKEMKERRSAIYDKEIDAAKTDAELDTLQTELRKLDMQIEESEKREAKEAAIEAEKRAKDPDGRTAAVNGEVPSIVSKNARSEDEKTKNAEKRDLFTKEKEVAEQRGKDLLDLKSVSVSARGLKIVPEKRSITVGSSNIVVPTYTDATLSQTFNEVSSLVDRVTSKMLIGGESYTKGYISGYGTGGYTSESADYTSAEPTFGYADINKTKVTAYAEDTEEILKLPTVDYDAEVINGIRIATRKYISRQILVGTGAANNIAGIFSTAASAIDSSTDVELSAIDEDTLDTIIFGYGGDENVEDTAVLILSKADLKAFSLLRDANGQKLHNIKVSGNNGTIDTVPFIINSACGTTSTASSGDYCMAYGPMSNYLLTIFSDMDVQRSTDYKFKSGQIAHRGSIFVGGNVIAKNGFLRVKKA